MAVAVRFDHVSKKFRTGEIHDSLRDLVSFQLRRLLGKGAAQESASTFWALRDVFFEVEPGKSLGIIGPNGAGKSTALKLLSGILRCDGGRIEVNGRLAALIEVGAGMHGDLTGMENIYLNGAVMGMTRREIRQKLDDIIAFSGLERFIDTPVKRYSTGMQARLGFATAAHVSPDILLVDEVLSVGDAAFRHRCEQRMTELVRGGTTLIFVTHNLEQMRRVCDQTLVLDHGKRAFFGTPETAVEHYLSATMNVQGTVGYTDHQSGHQAVADVLGLDYLRGDGQTAVCVDPLEPVQASVKLRLHEPVESLAVTINIRHMGGELFLSMGSQSQGVTYSAPAGVCEVSLNLPALPVASGTYLAQVRVWDMRKSVLIGETPYKFSIQVEDGGKTTGMLALPHGWSDLRPVESGMRGAVVAGAA